MFRRGLLLTALALFGQSPSAFSASSPDLVELQTNLGTIAIQLNYAAAPISTKNFMAYADSGFYANTLMHRVKKGFVLQGGGFDKVTGKLKSTLAPIANEANNGLSNLRGTVAMARTSDPNSATSQFFINLADNTFLDYSATSAGYAVFGTVTKGMEVAGQIENLGSYNELPITKAAGLIYVEAVYKTDLVQPSVANIRVLIQGPGRVVSTPSGINCGSVCTTAKALGKPIKLTAKPANGAVFTGWSGDCKGLKTVLAINPQLGNHNCTAVFMPINGSN
ncbi:MAG: peptidylprolyl isomerase [Methylococcales bacterium]|nr:peptidylprolyl isomerase [Methylococcales bacterium]